MRQIRWVDKGQSTIYLFSFFLSFPTFYTIFFFNKKLSHFIFLQQKITLKFYSILSELSLFKF